MTNYLSLPLGLETCPRKAPGAAIPSSMLSPLGIFPEICTSGEKNLSIGSSFGVSSALSSDVVIFEFSEPNRGSEECWSWDSREGLVNASLMEAAALSVLAVLSVGNLSIAVKETVSKVIPNAWMVVNVTDTKSRKLKCLFNQQTKMVTKRWTQKDAEF